MKPHRISLSSLILLATLLLTGSLPLLSAQGDLSGERLEMTATAQSVVRVSVAADRTEANGWSYNPSISADGQYVAFSPTATNLVDGDTNDSSDVLVALAVLGDGPVPAWPAPEVESTAPAVEPTAGQNGDLIAFIGRDWNVYLYHISNDEVQQITTDGSSRVMYSRPKWSPTGKDLALIRGGFPFSDSELMLLDVETMELTTLTSETSGGYDWSPDGDQIIYDKPAELSPRSTTGGYHWATYEGLWILDLASGQEHQVIYPQSDQPLLGPDWSPNGEYVAFGDTLPRVPYNIPQFSIAELEQGNPYQILDYGFLACDWSPDGTKLACTGVPFKMIPTGPCPVFVIDHRGSLVKTFSTEDNACDLNPLWSPDGQLIAVEAGVPSGEWSHIAETPLEWFVDIITVDGTERRRLMSGFPVGWSPDGRFLLAKDEGTISQIDVGTGAIREIGQGYDAAWQPARPTVNIEDYLARKEAVIPRLEQGSVDIVGIPFPIPLFDETAARALVVDLRTMSERDAITPEQADALARVALQEEAVSKLSPVYAQSSADFTEAGVDLIGMLLSISRKSDEALQACYTSGNPFSPACRHLARMINRQLLHLIDSTTQLLTRLIPDPEDREDAQRFLDLLMNSVSLELDTGGTVKDILLGQVVKGPLVSVQIRWYASKVQPSLDQGVRSATPNYTGTEPIWPVEGQTESAQIQMDSIVSNASTRGKFAHEAHEDLMRGVDWAKVVEDFTDLRRLSPAAALARCAGILTRVGHAAIDVYSMLITWNSKACARELSTMAGDLAFNPSQPIETCPDLSERIRRSLNLASAPTRGDTAAWMLAQSRIEDDSASYRKAVTNLVDALERGDPEEIAHASDNLDQADYELGISTSHAISVLADSNAPNDLKADIMSESNAFSVDALQFYLLTASCLTASEEEWPLDETRQAADKLLITLEEYTTALRAAAPVSDESRPLPVIGAMTYPDSVAPGETIEVTYEVTNIGSADAADVTVHVSGFGSLSVEETVNLGAIMSSESKPSAFSIQGTGVGDLFLRFQVSHNGTVVDSTLIRVRVTNVESEQAQSHSTLLIVGAGIGVVAGVVLSLGSAALIYMRHRKKATQADIPSQMCQFGWIAWVGLAGGVTLLCVGMALVALFIFQLSGDGQALPAQETHPSPTHVPGATIFPSLQPSPSGPTLMPTLAPVPSLTPLATLASSWCPGAPPQRVQVGDKAQVCTKSDSLTLRNQPKQGSSEIGQLDPGTTFTVIDGPRCADSWSWWQIQTDEGSIGWVAEGGDEVDPYFICPLGPLMLATCFIHRIW